jgi:porphobilinogen synthase
LTELTKFTEFLPKSCCLDLWLGKSYFSYVQDSTIQSEAKFARLRRLRHSPVLRDLVAEVSLRPADLILPLFVREGLNIRTEVVSMPGVFQLSPDQIVAELRTAEKLGIKAFILFGVIEKKQKDDEGNAGVDPDNIVCHTLKLIKNSGIQMAAITDLCFCEYTSHGHCGILTDHQHDRTVANDLTLPRLGQQAVNHARAGADIIAPSGMMDGMVGAIRSALDEAGFTQLPILSYAVKYASAFYGPFRDAAESAPSFGDRRSYQMDGRRRREALLEARADLEQGADMLMVKPGLPYLDIIRDLRNEFQVPLAAYQVSGEYSMIKAAGQKGWIDEKAVMLESLVSLKRAGADLILTYFACDAAKALR